MMAKLSDTGATTVSVLDLTIYNLAHSKRTRLMIMSVGMSEEFL